MCLVMCERMRECMYVVLFLGRSCPPPSHQARSSSSSSSSSSRLQLQTHWLDDSKTTLRLSWGPSSLPSSSSSSYRISYTRDGIPNHLTVGGGSEEAVLRGLEGGSTYDVVVVRVEGESLKETVVGRTKVETAKVLILIDYC